MGKLITSNTWYFAANLPKEAAGRLKEGETAVLRFSGELNRDVEMSVDRIGPTEGGLTLVVFSSNRYLTLTTLLRRQTVELIFESWSGLRIPKEGLRLVETAVPARTPASLRSRPPKPACTPLSTAGPNSARRPSYTRATTTTSSAPWVRDARSCGTGTPSSSTVPASRTDCAWRDNLHSR